MGLLDSATFLAFFVSSLGWASSFYEAPFPDTVRNASNIVRGKIGKSEAQWVALADGSKRLFTFYDVEVTEGFKGKAKTGTIRIRELGGEKDGVGMRVSGSADFALGEDVVVMLGNAVTGSENTYPLSGMMMGKYSLEKGADGKEYLRGSGLGSAIHPSMRKEGSTAMKDVQVSLDGLREIVRTQASEPPKPREKTAASPASREPLLTARGGEQESTPEHLTPSEPLHPTRSGSLVRPIYVLLGLAGGVFWFLKTRKNRR
jgi:hypothetical protein